ncbi:MAG: SLC13 family permease [Planctomycetota bacterium]
MHASSPPPTARVVAFRRWTLIIAPVVALLFGLVVDLQPGHPQVTRMAAVALLMAVWWMTEALPLAATALLPLALFPVLGIMNATDTATRYANDTIFLFAGAFVVALTIQRWNLHRRIALGVLRITGTTPPRLLFGFMAATAFLSMWISNTATAMMMVPIAMAVIARLSETHGEVATRRISIGLLIGIAWGASIGGIATKIGTPPNLSFTTILKNTFHDAPVISFAQWMMLAGPISLALFAFAWVLLWRAFCRHTPPAGDNAATSPTGDQQQLIADEYRKLGPVRREEWMVLAVFATMALLWITRTGLPIGDGVEIPGWVQLFGLVDAKGKAMVADGTIAIAMAVVLFMLPGRREHATDLAAPGGDDASGTCRLADASTFVKIPWGIVLLFGGGFALAAGFKDSGLSAVIGTALAGAAGVDPLLLILIISLVVTFLTELTSNTATTELLLPLLAAGAVAAQINPLALMIPATISASCAFMLPVATPPNAIIFGTGQVRIADMARYGLIINLAGAVLITVLVWVLVPMVLGEGMQLPAWAVLHP